MIVGGRFSFNGGENFIGKHFPPGVIAAGNPARVVRKVE
jgi:acetyltransferase-like isoleucine patch superfamily enzyme